MLKFSRSRISAACSLEPLEERNLLSGVHPGQGLGHGHAGTHIPPGSSAMFAKHFGPNIQFSQAPAAVQTGLNTLATAQSLPAPTATQAVYLGNTDGVETYSIVLGSPGATTRLTVDALGVAFTAPTHATTTFGAVVNVTVTNEINTIAAALGLTAPISTTKVKVDTPSSGPATYTVSLKNATTLKCVTFSVDDNGNPVGNAKIPFSALPAAIQGGLNTNTPTGMTPLAGTDLIKVRTAFGVTTYSATFSSTGVTTTVTVNAAGALASLPSVSSVQFSTLPAAAQTELQALATAAGVTTTIDPTTNVLALDEANGTTVYTVRLFGTATTPSGKTHKFPMIFSVDQLGNPTVVPFFHDFGEHDFGD